MGGHLLRSRAAVGKDAMREERDASRFPSQLRACRTPFHGSYRGDAVAMLRSAPVSRSRLLVARLLVGMAALVPPGAVHAQAETLGSFHHTVYRKEDGAPGSGDVAQTADGFLWIAGDKGLTRFDGVRFEKLRALPGESLPDYLGHVFPAPDGGLWIAGYGGATLLKDGHLSHFGPREGYEGALGVFFRDDEGRTWCFSRTGLLRFEGGAWKVDYRTPGKGQAISSAAFDGDGNLWAIMDRRLYVRAKGQSSFAEVPEVPGDSRRVFAGASGRIYVATPTSIGFFRRAGTRLSALAKPADVHVVNVLESRDGSLWMGSTTDGLYYLSGDALRTAESGRAVPALEHMGQPDGLSDNYAAYLWEDSEGDVWLNTSNGLDRFRRAAFNRIDLPMGIHTVASAVDRQGNLWVGSETHPLLFRGASGERRTTGIQRLTVALYADPQGDGAWAANTQGVWRLTAEGERLERPFAAKEVGTIGAVPCMIRDAAGAFYVCMPYTAPGNGLLRSEGEGWKEVFDHPVFPRSLALDARGNVWVGSQDKNRMYRLAGGVATLLDEHQGLKVGTVLSMFADAGGLWVGGEEGIQYFDGQRFLALPVDDPDIARPVTGIALDRHGDLWMQTLDGVLRFSAADVARVKAGDARPLHGELFGTEDNVAGSPDVSWTNPNLRAGGDGRLWVQTSSALAWVDPDRMPAARMRPRVVIDGLSTASGERLAPGGDLRLGPDDKVVRIVFTSPSLSRPDRVGFRYRLVGMNDAWIDAGSRREAVFTNLAPGDYRFEVVASNDAGLASEHAATLGFRRMPAYYETWWFRALWLLPVALVLWLLHSARSRALARRMRIRSDEREAVARDIHDTLLQRLHSILVSLQELAVDEAMPSASRSMLARIRDEARAAIVDGRERIVALRREHAGGLALYDVLMAEGRRLQGGSDVHFALEVHGSPRPLRAAAAAELCDVALEAVRNAFAHAGASSIRVTLDYEDSAFWIVVSDDGKGFGEQEAGRARREGHFGLVGMRERMARLRGAVNIESAPGEGVDVHLSVPARFVYEGRPD